MERRIRLVHREVQLTLDATDDEVQRLFTLLNDPELVSLWRGDTTLRRPAEFGPRFQEWVTKEWGFYFLIRYRRELAGICYEYRRSLQNSRTCVTALIRPELILTTGIGAYAATLFADFLFKFVRVDSIFYECYSYNESVIRAMRSLNLEETTIPEYHFHDGELHSFHLFRVRRSNWAAISARVLR